MDTYEYKCTECNNIFYTDYKKISNKQGVCFCSNTCRGVYQFKKRPLLSCAQCNKPFYANWDKRQRKKPFCCQKCYWLYKKITGYGANPESLKNARKNSHTKKALKKIKDTKIKNGTWLSDDIIVKGLTFKQYRRKVYRITKKIKQLLIKEWDGYDFYDKQYIKDNFKLPFTHGDYPSIDHVKSLQQGFKEGISPVDICKKENLVWTKKRINSSKHTKNNYV